MAGQSNGGDWWWLLKVSLERSIGRKQLNVNRLILMIMATAANDAGDNRRRRRR